MRVSGPSSAFTLGILVLAVAAASVAADTTTAAGGGISATLTDTPDPVPSRGTVTYVYRLTNTSPTRIPDPPPPPFETESNSNIDLQLDVSGFYGGSITSLSTSRGSCFVGVANPTPDDSTDYSYIGHCRLGILQPGESAEVTAQVRVPRADSACPRTCVELTMYAGWIGNPDDTAHTIRNATTITPEPTGSGTGTTPVNCGKVRRGTAKADRLVGTSGRDKLLGLAGNDTLRGLSGDDCLFGGTGRDKLDGGRGKDYFDAGVGDDVVLAADGHAETVRCGAGRDQVTADVGDRLTGCERVKRMRR